jgi:hypothetical protein
MGGRPKGTGSRSLRVLPGGGDGGPRREGESAPRLVRPRFEGDLARGLFLLRRDLPDPDPEPPDPQAA